MQSGSNFLTKTLCLPTNPNATKGWERVAVQTGRLGMLGLQTCPFARGVTAIREFMLTLY